MVTFDGASGSAEVEFPALAVIAVVVAGLVGCGQVVLAQHDARPAVLRVQGDHDAGGAGLAPAHPASLGVHLQGCGARACPCRG